MCARPSMWKDARAVARAMCATSPLPRTTSHAQPQPCVQCAGIKKQACFSRRCPSPGDGEASPVPTRKRKTCKASPVAFAARTEGLKAAEEAAAAAGGPSTLCTTLVCPNGMLGVGVLGL